MMKGENHLVAARDPESGQLWLKGTEDWQEEHFCRVGRYMHEEQMRGICEYPVNGHELCDTCCETCEYCHVPYRSSSSSRVRHISGLLDEVLEDLADMRES